MAAAQVEQHRHLPPGRATRRTTAGNSGLGSLCRLTMSGYPPPMTPEPTSSASDRVDPSPWGDPRISQWLMTMTYVVGAIGYFLGFARLSNGADEAVTPVALLSVGVVGVISMVRHSVFHRSDALRMGWDTGTRNNFQIETGFANLAIGVPAILAVAYDWGVAAQAGFTLAYALYFLQVSVLVGLDRTEGKLDVRRLVVMLLQTAFLGYFALAALQAASISPF